LGLGRKIIKDIIHRAFLYFTHIVLPFVST